MWGYFFILVNIMKERLIPMHKLEKFEFVESDICHKYLSIPDYYEQQTTKNNLRGMRINNRRVLALIRNRVTDVIAAYVTDAVITGDGSLNNPMQHNFNYYANKELLMELLLLKG